VAQDYYELPDQEHGRPRETSPAVGRSATATRWFGTGWPVSYKSPRMYHDGAATGLVLRVTLLTVRDRYTDVNS
jgi:hypothetical protein